jgi:hypothetical protein
MHFIFEIMTAVALIYLFNSFMKSIAPQRRPEEDPQVAARFYAPYYPGDAYARGSDDE